MAINDKYIKGPFKADFHGGIVWGGPNNFHFADVRGWSELGYKGDGAKIQDANLQFMVDALNEKVARDAKETFTREQVERIIDLVNHERKPPSDFVTECIDEVACNAQPRSDVEIEIDFQKARKEAHERYNEELDRE